MQMRKNRQPSCHPENHRRARYSRVKTKGSKIVDQALLNRLAGLSVRISRRVEGNMTGKHRSPFHGSSVEFAQHREYVPGDEIRHVDWRSYARTDRYYVKQFEDETNVRVHLVLDTSASMDFAHESNDTKFVYGCRLAAAMAWCFIRQGDAIGLLAHGARIDKYVPPSSQANQFWRLVETLEALKPSGPTRLGEALVKVAELSGRRSHVIILSDCLDFDGQLTGLARQLVNRSHDVTVVHILDRAEVEFPFGEVTRFEELESDDFLLVDPRAMRSRILESVRGLAKTIENRV